MNLGADLFSLSDPRAHKYAKPLPKAASWKMADELLVAVLSSSPAGSAGLAGDGVTFVDCKRRWRVCVAVVAMALRAQGPLPFHSLSHPKRKDFYDRAAEVAVKRPELFYLAAAGVVAAQFNVRIDDCDRKAIKNAVSRRAAAAKQLAILKACVPPSLMRT
eukprot:jgi/Tetstr1/420279/TSEL_001028.t1